jgi:hypothetical protein
VTSYQRVGVAQQHGPGLLDGVGERLDRLAVHREVVAGLGGEFRAAQGRGTAGAGPGFDERAEVENVGDLLGGVLTQRASARSGRTVPSGLPAASWAATNRATTSWAERKLRP